jgi:hypothetical protein
MSFAQSDLLPTYLLSFAAGDFKHFKEKIGFQDAGMLYRETDTIKIKNSMDSIYNLYRNSLAYYENGQVFRILSRNMGWLLFLIFSLEEWSIRELSCFRTLLYF